MELKVPPLLSAVAIAIYFSRSPDGCDRTWQKQCKEDVYFDTQSPGAQSIVERMVAREASSRVVRSPWHRESGSREFRPEAGGVNNPQRQPLDWCLLVHTSQVGLNTFMHIDEIVYVSRYIYQCLYIADTFLRFLWKGMFAFCFFVYVFVPRVASCACKNQQRPGEGIRFSGTGIRGGCELPCGCYMLGTKPRPLARAAGGLLSSWAIPPGLWLFF